MTTAFNFQVSCAFGNVLFLGFRSLILGLDGMICFSQNIFDRQRRKSSVDGSVDIDSLQAGFEKLAMKPKVGWCVVHHTYVIYWPTKLAISLLMLC